MLKIQRAVVGGALRSVGAALVAMILAIVACAPGDEGGDASSLDLSAEDPCLAVPVRGLCSSVYVEQIERYVRYSVHGSGVSVDGAQTKALLVDFGGPGVAVLGDATPSASFEALLPQGVTEQFVYVVIEEPWVLHPMPEECREALRSFADEIDAIKKGGGSPPDASIGKHCELGDGNWGWTRESYLASIRAIERAESVKIDAMAAISFGAIRASYLDFPLETLILHHPFPLGADPDDLIDTRSEVVIENANRLGVEVGSTSTFTELSAAIALSQVSSVEADDLAKSLEEEQTPQLATKLEAALWQRYGDGRDISPAYLAFLDEACPYMYAPQTAETDEAVAAMLRLATAPCSKTDHDVSEPLHLPQADAVCITSSSNDAVAPLPLVEEAFPGHNIMVDESFHSEAGLMGVCLEELL